MLTGAVGDTEDVEDTGGPYTEGAVMASSWGDDNFTGHFHGEITRL